MRTCNDIAAGLYHLVSRDRFDGGIQNMLWLCTLGLPPDVYGLLRLIEFAVLADVLLPPEMESSS